MNVCMYVWLYVCVLKCGCIYCILIYPSEYSFYARMISNECMHGIYSCMHVYICVCMHVCMYMYMAVTLCMYMCVQVHGSSSDEGVGGSVHAV